jgi:lytic murein transglycosylase
MSGCPNDRGCARYAKRSAWLILALFLAVSCAPPARADDAFQQWLAVLWGDAQAKGITRATFVAAFKGVTPDTTLPDLIIPGRPKRQSKGQAEFIKTPAQYMSEKSLTWLTETAKKVLADHGPLLAAIEKRMGVDRYVILAIFGRETAFGGAATGYGSYVLKHNAIRALATQAYLGRRKKYFRFELLLALRILQEGHVKLKDMKASWAGAMGFGQFMPSNFYDYGVDFDGDGKRDIWHSLADSLATTAKSLEVKGWQTGKTWGYEMRAPASMDCSHEGPRHSQPISAWQSRGFRRAFGQKFLPQRLPEDAYLLVPAGTHGPAFLMLKNFRVIKSYNPSDLYALFVGHLADRIRGGGLFERPWGAVKQLKEEDVAEMQDRLNKFGINAGKVDGKAGARTRRALGAYQRAHRLKMDCWPSGAMLVHMRKTATVAR